MLQKAIIEKKIDKYSMKVRIPVYNKIKSDPTATPTEDLYTAIIQTLPGCSPNYQEGDLVLVEFENDNISLPVIVGLLYRENMPEGSTDLIADSLTVNVNSSLSENTLIGSVTPESIKKLNDKYANNVKNVSVEYSLSNYQDHYDQFSQWSEQAPQHWPGKFMWQRTTVTYENGLTTRSMTCIQGADGEPGSAITIEESYTKYAINNSGTVHPSTSGTWYVNPPQTTDVNPYLWSWTYVRYSDGTSTEAFGVSRTSANSLIVYLYKRSATVISQIDWQNTLVYDFDTKQFQSVPTGWYSSIPSGNDPIYVTAATVSSVQSTGSILPAEWSAPIQFTKSGFNSKTVLIYKRAASTPAVPSSSVTYIFSTGTLNPASPSGWSLSVPTSNGNPCYVTQATAISYEDTDTIETSEWSSPSILAQDGSSDYIDQSIVDWYIATSTTTTPTSPTTDIEVASEWTTLGWTNNISSITLSDTNKYLWNAEVTHYSISGYVKTNPHIITVYAEGQSGVGISSIVEYYALSTTTTRPSTGWSTTTPTMDAVNRYLWNYSVITYTDGSTSGTVNDALIIGVYGDSVLSVEIQSDNGTFFNTNTLSTTLSTVVYLGATELTVNNSGSVISGGTTIGQLNWFAKERFVGNGTATTFDLGLEILNYNSNPTIEVTIDGVATTDYTVSDADTIIFTTAPADNSVILVTYLTSTSSSILIRRTDVRNQIIIICKIILGVNALATSEVTIKDLNDATSIKNWYMTTLSNIQGVSTPIVDYDPSDYTVTPSGEYTYQQFDETLQEYITVTEQFDWLENPPVVNQETLNKICYSFQMIIFSDNSCSAAEVQRDSSFDSGVTSYQAAQSASDKADQAQSTANSAAEGVQSNATEITGIQSTLTSINGTLAGKLDTVVFEPYQYGMDSFIKFDVPHAIMTLGKGNFTQQLSSTKNSFMDGEVEVAYVSNQELNINKAIIKNQLEFNQKWIVTFDDTDGLIIKHI